MNALKAQRDDYEERVTAAVRNQFDLEEERALAVIADGGAAWTPPRFCLRSKRFLRRMPAMSTSNAKSQYLTGPRQLVREELQTGADGRPPASNPAFQGGEQFIGSLWRNAEALA